MSTQKCTNLWFITAELTVAVCKPLQTNRELDVTTANDILDFELRKLGVESKLLNNASVLARRQPRVVLRLRARNDHLSRRENQGCRLGITDPHDDGGETLLKWTNVGTVRTLQSKYTTNLGVVFRIPCVQCDCLQVESAIQVHSGDDVLEGRNDTLHSGDVLLLESQRSRSGGYDGLGGRSGNSVSSGLGGGL